MNPSRHDLRVSGNTGAAIRRWRLLGLGLLALAGSAMARQPAWTDTPARRQAAAQALQALNADLLAHASATLTLERWCGTHRLASPARIVARRVHDMDKPLPTRFRQLLGIDDAEPVAYRRVQLACGDHVLSEADNWYLPRRLTAAMNDRLDHSDAPFGKVVQPLHFRRRTLDAQMLWSPATSDTAALPHLLLQHHAVLYDGEGRPFSALVESYTDEVLAFPAPQGAATNAGG